MTICECGCGTSAVARFVRGHNNRGRVLEREPLQAKWTVNPQTHCWEWQRAKNALGYGCVWDSKRKRYTKAHRVVYERYVGPIPEGLELDHLCRNTSCVNPEHLEPVTHRVNVQRGARGQRPLVHGTWNGYKRELAWGIPTCEDCRAANRARTAAYKARRAS